MQIQCRNKIFDIYTVDEATEKNIEYRTDWRNAKKTDNPIITKLLKLKYRINDTAKAEGGWSDDISNDKNYVMTLMSDIRKHGFKTLSPEDGHCCNGLWRKYS